METLQFVKEENFRWPKHTEKENEGKKKNRTKNKYFIIKSIHFDFGYEFLIPDIRNKH